MDTRNNISASAKYEQRPGTAELYDGETLSLHTELSRENMPTADQARQLVEVTNSRMAVEAAIEQPPTPSDNARLLGQTLFNFRLWEEELSNSGVEA
jgi:hypothetical protein